MNGELAHMADLVVTGKHYLRSGVINVDLYNNRGKCDIVFNFIDKSSQLDIEDWFSELKKETSWI